MNLVEKLADDLTRAIADKYLYFSNPQKADIRAMIVRQFQPLIAEPQECLNFDVEAKKSADQRARILALLKKRRSEGATNVEFSDICLNYTARISELRQPPNNYDIKCTREKGRVTRYRLHAFQW